MYEVLMSKKNEIDNSEILQTLNLKSKKFYLVSAHREENINSKNFFYLIDTLNTLAEKYQLPIIVTTHPRTRKMIETNDVKFHHLVQTMKPLGFIDYNKLQIEAKCVLSDSGTISEEASILKFHALNIRESHERPEAMEEATVMMVGLRSDRIIQALDLIDLNQNNIMMNVKDYTTPNVSDKILRIILSYVDYVNLNVWREK
jgi:UDP-N-acetylglucosamine 2-epimerase (non-hydrolysing)